MTGGRLHDAALGPFGRAWTRVEDSLSRLTTDRLNPFYFLGALSILFLWVILVTGVYLFIFYGISARNAYDSVEALTHGQWWLGGVMRSLHRYASDLLMVTTALHAFRCFALGRFAHWRKAAWVTGVAIVWAVVVGGLFGYWMVWDERARVVAEFVSRMLESVPIFGIPLSFNFASPDNLTDQLFYIVLFVHFSSLFVVFILLLLHLGRITRAVITPPRRLMYGALAALLAMSFIKPALSAPPADLKSVPASVPFDWFYMFVLPGLKHMSEPLLWLFLVFLTLAVSVVPWMTTRRRAPAVRLTAGNCTGCELCVADCPYAAIQMRRRTDGRDFELEAVVSDKRCAGCGICVGACDYHALNLPGLEEAALLERTRRLSRELSAEGGAAVFVFYCARGARPELDGQAVKGLAWTRAIELPCIGMLQPAMLSIPFEEGVGGVFIAGCAMGDCHFRSGNMWLDARLRGLRAPLMKKTMDLERLRAVWLTSAAGSGLMEGLRDFQSGLAMRGERAAAQKRPEALASETD